MILTEDACAAYAEALKPYREASAIFRYSRHVEVEGKCKYQKYGDSYPCDHKAKVDGFCGVHKPRTPKTFNQLLGKAELDTIKP